MNGRDSWKSGPGGSASARGFGPRISPLPCAAFSPRGPASITTRPGTATRRLLVALFVLSPVSRACLAFNALVSDPDYPSSFRVWVIAAAALAAGLGYALLNVQGSEDHAQHLSKRKLRPVTELPKTHLVFAR